VAVRPTRVRLNGEFVTPEDRIEASSLMFLADVSPPATSRVAETATKVRHRSWHPARARQRLDLIASDSGRTAVSTEHLRRFGFGAIFKRAEKLLLTMFAEILAKAVLP
jgi:hypothetical protein